MSAESFIVTLVGVLVVVYAFVALAAYLRKRGTPLIVPETEPGEGPVETLLRNNHARTTAASAPVATAPAGTRTGDLLRAWFANKSCTICERPIPPIQRIEQHPGLMNPESPSHDVVTWEQFARDERLPELLETHLPVCANCVMAETFRRQYPDLVIDRGEHGRHSPSVH